MSEPQKSLSRVEVLYQGLTEFLKINDCSEFESASLLLSMLGTILGEFYTKADTDRAMTFLKDRAKETRKQKRKS